MRHAPPNILTSLSLRVARAFFCQRRNLAFASGRTVWFSLVLVLWAPKGEQDKQYFLFWRLRTLPSTRIFKGIGCEQRAHVRMRDPPGTLPADLGTPVP